MPLVARIHLFGRYVAADRLAGVRNLKIDNVSRKCETFSELVVRVSSLH